MSPSCTTEPALLCPPTPVLHPSLCRLLLLLPPGGATAHRPCWSISLSFGAPTAAPTATPPFAPYDIVLYCIDCYWFACYCYCLWLPHPAGFHTICALLLPHLAISTKATGTSCCCCQLVLLLAMPHPPLLLLLLTQSQKLLTYFPPIWDLRNTR